jgi:hypothetical protein
VVVVEVPRAHHQAQPPVAQADLKYTKKLPHLTLNLSFVFAIPQYNIKIINYMIIMAPVRLRKELKVKTLKNYLSFLFYNKYI